MSVPICLYQQKIIGIQNYIFKIICKYNYRMNNKKQKSNNDNTPHSILAKQLFDRNSSKFINDEKENPGNDMCGLITTAFSQSHFNES